MLGFQIAAQTIGLPGPFKKALHIAAALGCDGVQINARQELRPTDLSHTGLREVRKTLSDLNLTVGSIAFPTRHGYACADHLEQRLEATLAAMQMASHLNARVLVCNLGNLPTEEMPDQQAALSDAILSLAAHGDRLGVRLAAQATFTELSTLADFVNAQPEGAIALDLHPPRLIAQGITPTDFVASVGDHIAHVHATDAIEGAGHAARDVEVVLGRGSADFPQLVGMLEEFSYRGWLTIERTMSNQPVEDVGNAVKFLRSL